MIATTQPRRTMSVFGSPMAFGRKLRYALSRLVLVNSFAPLKRLLDIAVSTLALAFTAPFIVLFAISRLLRRREIVRRTEKVGRLGLRYIQYSFAGLKNHPVLRRIPILINIFAGEMSLIGPRAVVPGDPAARANGFARLAIKPGAISPWWLRQRANIDFDDEAAADREYLCRTTLASDLGIALRAIPALAFSEQRETAPATVEILGIRIDNMSMAEAIGWIQRRLDGEPAHASSGSSSRSPSSSPRRPPAARSSRTSTSVAGPTRSGAADASTRRWSSTCSARSCSS